MMRNLLHKRNVWALAILMVIAALGIAQAATTRPQTASLSGQVVTAVSVGASVQEGSVLVTVKTLAGSASAAEPTAAARSFPYRQSQEVRFRLAKLLPRLKNHNKS